MSDYMTAGDLAVRLGCSPRKVREEARRLGLGFNLGGRAGYRFTEGDTSRLTEALRPKPAPARRRRRAS